MNFPTNRVQPEQINVEQSLLNDFIAQQALMRNEPETFVETPSADDYEFSRLELACDTYRLFRNNGFSRWESLRHFFKALKGSV